MKKDGKAHLNFYKAETTAAEGQSPAGKLERPHNVRPRCLSFCPLKGGCKMQLLQGPKAEHKVEFCRLLLGIEKVKKKN